MAHRMSLAVAGICLGIGMLGIFGYLLPVVSAAEENFGLHLLYLMRGPLKAPANVVVVAIDRDSSKALNLPAAPHKWPRTLHARLLETLKAMQASVVVFDLIFYEHQAAESDQALASAMRDFGNVILTQTIDRNTMPLKDGKGARVAQVNIDKLVSAIPMLADASAGQAPFPLPKVPVKLNQYWRFLPGSGDVPTLPVVALHAFDAHAFEGFIQILRKVDPAAVAVLPFEKEGEPVSIHRIIQTIRPLYTLFEKKPDLAQRMLQFLDAYPPANIHGRDIDLVRALISLYKPGYDRFLNLYGPPGSIETISYHKLLDSVAADQSVSNLPSLKGKAVFVGQTESDWYKANDGFYTAYTKQSGMDISGVEIAATAFANLLEDKAVHPLGPAVSCVFFLGWGTLLVLIGFRFSPAASAAGILLLNGAYIGLAFFQFQSGGLWYPIVIPVLVQTPAAYMAGLISKNRRANLERRNIREAFGYYLPNDVVDRLASNIKELHSGGQVLYGICLFTDAESYTPLSESMDPESLTHLMNTYYEALFTPIKNNQGLVLQVVGDSVLAIWAAPQPDDHLKAAACRTAVQITEAVRQFNQKAGRHLLPTRIGIHAGKILLGNIGALNHFEYRPVGDIVNTASRLEGLNKHLGTRMLTSEEAFCPDHGYLTRSVGRFIFKGKSRPVQVREILPENEMRTEVRAAVNRIFSCGLQALQDRYWDEAGKLFNQVLKLDPSDGPSRFYLKLCRQFSRQIPADDWDGAVHLMEK